MKKEQLVKLKTFLSVLSLGAVMTWCCANNEKQTDIQNEELDKALTKDGAINPTYEGYYLEIKSYSTPDFDLYTTKSLNVGGKNYLPEDYEFMEFSNETIGYKVIIKSDDIESVDVKKYTPLKNEKGDIISYTNIPKGYTLTDDLEFCYRCNLQKTKSLKF